MICIWPFCNWAMSGRYIRGAMGARQRALAHGREEVSRVESSDGTSEHSRTGVHRQPLNPLPSRHSPRGATRRAGVTGRNGHAALTEANMTGIQSLHPDALSCNPKHSTPSRIGEGLPRPLRRLIPVHVHLESRESDFPPLRSLRGEAQAHSPSRRGPTPRQ